VRTLCEAGFLLRPGLFVFAADDPPSPVSSAAKTALDSIGFSPSFGTGYRVFVEERRRVDPNWRGITFQPDQGFVIAIGRRPAL
jgi:hypothetical protein